MALRQEENFRSVNWVVLLFLGLPIFGALCFFLWFSTANSVGRLNFVTIYPTLDDIVEAAERAPLQPGEGMTANLDGDTLVAHEFFGNVAVFKTPSGSIVVKVDRGGGHLGNQGYLYSEDINTNAAEAFGYDQREGYDTSRMSLRWWSYDSTED